MTKRILTQEELKEQLHYNPETGIFTRIAIKGGYKTGSIAGSKSSDGYVCIKVIGRNCTAHRLAWLYMTGKMSSHEIDHINGVRDDNRFLNLRVATDLQNAVNAKIRKDNTSGYKGVSYRKDSKKWQAKISINGKELGLGCYESAYDAWLVYRKKAIELHGEFYRE